jgi:Nuclease-related domain
MNCRSELERHRADGGRPAIVRDDSHCELVLVSYPRRQQLRRLRRAGSYGALAAFALAGAVLVAVAGNLVMSLGLMLVSGLFALASRRVARLAARSRVGAESEAEVRRALKQLAHEGWRVRHAVDWPGGGDVDHVVRSPLGTGFAIETKTLRWRRAHVARTRDAARWLARRRRLYPRGVVPVLCVARARHLDYVDGNVQIVSLDRLVPLLRAAGDPPPVAASPRSHAAVEKT